MRLLRAKFRAWNLRTLQGSLIQIVRLSHRKFRRRVGEESPERPCVRCRLQLRSARTRRLPSRHGPKKLSVAKLPVTGSDLFGREEDVAFLDDAWANQAVNVVTIVAWGGVGKSILVNHWLRRMAAEQYRST